MFIGLSCNPLVNLKDLKYYTDTHNLGITVDTTHYAEVGVDLIKALKLLKDRIRTVHASDFSDKRRHIFIGEGILNWSGIFKVLNDSKLYLITLECGMSSIIKREFEMTKEELIKRLKEAKARLSEYLH